MLKTFVESLHKSISGLVELSHVLHLINFLSGVGVFATFINLIASDGSLLGEIISGIIVLIFVAFAAIAIQIKQLMKSKRLIVIPSNESRPHYYVDVAPTLADTTVALLILKEHFKDEVIPADVFLKVQKGNPNCIVVVKNKMGEIVGIGDYHGLDDSLFNAFIAGTIDEKEFLAVSFLTRSELGKANRVYLGGISVSKKWRAKENEIAQAAAKGIENALYRTFLDGGKKRRGSKFDIYAIGASKQGQLSLDSNGFERVDDGTSRRPFPMYSRSMTISLLSRLRHQPVMGNFDVTIKF